MIPLRDHNHPTSRPTLTYTLIAANVAMFLVQFAQGNAADLFVARFGVVPYYLTEAEHPGTWITPLTSMFMHGGFMHIVSNMWFLHVFGDNVEDCLGKGRYLVFYLGAGLAAIAAQVLLDPASKVPMIGASGAVAGVLGGYVLQFPRARVVTLVPIFIFLQFIEIPAYFFIFIWFGLQLVGGLGALGSIGMNLGGVAFFAHIGGFVAGLVLMWLLRRSGGRPARRVRYVPREARRVS